MEKKDFLKEQVEQNKKFKVGLDEELKKYSQDTFSLLGKIKKFIDII